MKRIWSALVVAALTAGCVSGPADLLLSSHGTPKSLGEALATLKGDAVVDLDAALAIAQKPRPGLPNGDVIGATCWPALKAFLVAQTGTSTPTVDQIRGVFSAWEKARVERMTLESKFALGSPIPPELKLGCAAMVQDDREFALRLAALIAGGVATK